MGKLKTKARGGGIKGRRKSRSKAQRAEAKMNIIRQQQKNNQGEKKVNPFDLVFAARYKKTNASRGGKKRVTNNQWSKPNSTEIRKHTLDVEFKRRRKANQMIDKRLGQRDIELSEEAKAEKRFLFQQAKLAKMKSTTHTDTGLEENTNDAEKRVHWKDLNEDDDEENADDGGDDDEGQQIERKNRKETLSDLVAHNRRLRAIKSMLRDEQEEQTEHLDKCYSEMRQLGLLQPGSRATDERKEKQSEPDPYDSMYRVLQFEPAPSVQARKPNHQNDSDPMAKKSSQTEKEEKEERKKEAEHAEKREEIGLKMLEPRFDEHFNPERPRSKGNSKNSASSSQREKQWEKKVKRERRGAIKELRKDARHLAGLYSEQQRKIRRERDEKTKRIMQTLEVQESEYKKLRAIGGKL